MPLLGIFFDQEGSKVKHILTHHKGLRQKTLWLLWWSRFFVGHEHVSVELIDRWKFTDCLQTQIEGSHRAHDFKFENLGESTNFFGEELDIDFLRLLWSDDPSGLVFGHWW